MGKALSVNVNYLNISNESAEYFHKITEASLYTAAKMLGLKIYKSIIDLKQRVFSSILQSVEG